MAKIAVEVERALAQRAANGGPGRTTARVLACGNGWSVADVVCTSGPQDRPFEERHSGISIAIVAAGSFQYRSGAGRDLMTPGSLLLGNAGQCFECGHEHGTGDRCLAFGYAPDYFERLAADAGVAVAGRISGCFACRPCARYRRWWHEPALVWPDPRPYRGRNSASNWLRRRYKSRAASQPARAAPHRAR